MPKVWNKGEETLDPTIEKYEVGVDYLYDGRLFKYELAATIAHVIQLEKIGILSKEEARNVINVLKALYQKYGNVLPLSIEDEDIHSKVELLITQELGDTGKKIHTGRSRNDQVITILRLFEKEELLETSLLYTDLLEAMIEFAKKEGKKILPGYTHTKQAMLVNVAFWIAGFIELSLDNIQFIKNILELIDKNPLGSGSGFGVPLQLDRQLTANLLNFSKIQTSPMAVQNSRGKYEAWIVDSLWNIMNDFSRIAEDLLLFNMDELMYVKTNDNITTGSSIMPQKKNFDVMELIRARSKIVLANSFAIKNIISDLVSGYNRDTQEVKEPLIKSFVIVKETIQTLKVVFANIEFDEEAIKKHLSRGIFATDLAYKLVKQNYSFREAYKIASQKIEELEVKDNIIQESIKNRISEGSPATIDLKKYEKKIKEEKTTLKAKSDTFKECMKKLLEG